MGSNCNPYSLVRLIGEPKAKERPGLKKKKITQTKLPRNETRLNLPSIFISVRDTLIHTHIQGVGYYSVDLLRFQD